MATGRSLFVVAVFGIFGGAGCSAPVSHKEPHHVGAEVNIGHFAKNTASYKGRTLSLSLKVDEAIALDLSQSLRNWAGRDVKFVTAGAEGEKLNILIAIPKDLIVPEVGKGDEVFVVFACTRGDVGKGNEAKSIELPW